MKKFRMLDLFSGLGGAHRAMEEDPEWKVTTVDNQEKFEPDVCEDILDLGPEDFDDSYNLVWASPPCVCFSVSSLSHYWDENTLPARRKVADHVRLAYHTLWLIGRIDPEYWFLENPRGMMRRVLPIRPAGTVTYCQYGKDYMKPTDLYGEHPPSFVYRSCNPNDDCHERNPRNLHDSACFEKNAAERAKVPYGLSKAVKESVEDPDGTTLLSFDKTFSKSFEEADSGG